MTESKNPTGVVEDAATDIPRDHVTDADQRDANVHVPEGMEHLGSRAAHGNPATPADAADPASVPLGQASAAPQSESQVYSDTQTSKNPGGLNSHVDEAKQETDRQRAKSGIDPEEAREITDELDKKRAE